MMHGQPSVKMHGSSIVVNVIALFSCIRFECALS